MIVVLELLVLLGIVGGLAAASVWCARNQTLYYRFEPSKIYVRGNNVYNGKSVWRLPFTTPITTVNIRSGCVRVDGDILTQFGVVGATFVLHARINDPKIASTFAAGPSLSAYDVLTGCYHKIKAVLQSVLNEAGSPSMVYTAEIHRAAHQKLQEFCERHGLEMEEMAFHQLELKSIQSVSVHKENPVLEQFNTGKNSLKSN